MACGLGGGQTSDAGREQAGRDGGGVVEHPCQCDPRATRERLILDNLNTPLQWDTQWTVN